MELTAGQVIQGRYVVETELGRGGMAAVYRVRHAQLGTLAALKVLTLSSRAVQRRLMKEGRAQAALQHPNIVSVSDVVMVDGAPGLVMEYVRGPSLEQLLAAGSLSPDQADSIVRGVLSGVAAAHEHGLVHRDLKPANVMIAIHGSRPVPKVADFGLVKILEAGGNLNRTRSGVAMGTPAYMAPEQIADAAMVDQRADIFALGAILYEILAGRQAFRGTDIAEVFLAIKHGKYPTLRGIDGIPDRMIDAVHGALQLDPADRFPDVHTLLEAWSGDDPSSASPWNFQQVSDMLSMGGGGTSSREALAQPPSEPIPPPAPETTRLTPPRLALDDPTVFPDARVDSWALAPDPPTDPAPVPPPAHGRARWIGFVVAVLPMMAVLGVAAGWAERTGPAIAPSFAPEIPEVMAAEPQVAQVVRMEPGSPRGTAPPDPTPIRPAPESLPDPEAAPDTPTSSEPAHPAVPNIWLASDVTVAFVNEHGRPVPVDALGVGSYEVQAFFDVAHPTSQGTHFFGPDEDWVVRCRSTSMRCSIGRR